LGSGLIDPKQLLEIVRTEYEELMQIIPIGYIFIYKFSDYETKLIKVWLDLGLSEDQYLSIRRS